MSPDFYDVLVRSPGYVEEMTRYSRGVWSSRLRLYPDEFLALRAPVPSMDEQVRIACRFHERREGGEQLIQVLERQLAALQERRSSLITAAVTGEMEVP